MQQYSTYKQSFSLQNQVLIMNLSILLDFYLLFTFDAYLFYDTDVGYLVSSNPFLLYSSIEYFSLIN